MQTEQEADHMTLFRQPQKFGGTAQEQDVIRGLAESAKVDPKASLPRLPRLRGFQCIRHTPQAVKLLWLSVARQARPVVREIP